MLHAAAPAGIRICEPPPILSAHMETWENVLRRNTQAASGTGGAEAEGRQTAGRENAPSAGHGAGRRVAEEMKMTEARMFLPVKKWLERQGFQVFGEIELPLFYRSIDVVAYRGKTIVCVELKLNMTKKAIHQAAVCQLVGNAYVGVYSKPRSLDHCRKAGLGVLRIHGAQVDVLLEPKPPFKPSVTWVQRALKTCQAALEVGYHGVGGVPCQAGVGPAIEMESIIKSYRRRHPEATWRELYETIPNHYASASSMRSALDNNRQRRFIRERLKKEKAKAAV